mmetsp:Transcript_30020/g.49586  ORF Transcript_30020/g.49586 Transcript_30020/m.49586 type:complete len:669 (-) Transcript_30020:281-2287(-)
MPTWEGIEDASPAPARVWLSRLTDEDEWKPLRKADCLALNNSSPNSSVLIEGGRATADPLRGIIRYNFYNAPSRQLTSATWFTKEEKSSKEVLLRPIPDDDANTVEIVYQLAVEATSSLGKGLDSVLTVEKELLVDTDYKVVIFKSGTNALSMKKKPVGWFGNSYDLQRGYNEYSVEGEEEEMLLGPVTHLIFVIHGIGQAFINREDVKMKNMIEEIDATRLMVQKRQVAEWKKACEKATKAGEPEPPVPNRLEVLPIEWWDKIHNSSSSLVRSLHATTLTTIPGFRSIANDVVFDVLMYLTPTFCETVLECVTGQIDDLYHGFEKVHPGFVKNGGKCSIIGHSLGSVIAWDLLSILKDRQESAIDVDKDDEPMLPFLCGGMNLAGDGVNVGYQAYAAKTEEQGVNAVKHGAWGPSLPKPMKKCIPFIPDFTLFLGSPIGMFLTLRGAHAVFDEMLQMTVLKARAKATEAAADAEAEETATTDEKANEEKPAIEEFVEPITSPFTLPSGSIYNVFHPSDPVAYRIEPLLLAQELADTKMHPPQYLTPKGQKVRLHLQAKQLGDDFVKSFQEKSSSVKGFFTAITEQATAALQTLGDGEEASKRQRVANLKQGPLNFALGGTSNRIDFCLQPGVIENEYFAAVTAHSCYFNNPDVIDFVLELALGVPAA